MFAAVVNFVLAYTCSTVPLCFCFVLLILFRKALFLNTKHFSKKMHLDFHLVIFFIFFLKIWLNYANRCFAFSFSSTWYGSWRRCRYWLQKILCYLMPCHETTPQNIHTRWRPSWPETRLRAYMFMCPRGHFIVDRFLVHISETICSGFFFTIKLMWFLSH